MTSFSCDFTTNITTDTDKGTIAGTLTINGTTYKITGTAIKKRNAIERFYLKYPRQTVASICQRKIVPEVISQHKLLQITEIPKVAIIKPDDYTGKLKISEEFPYVLDDLIDWRSSAIESYLTDKTQIILNGCYKVPIDLNKDIYNILHRDKLFEKAEYFNSHHQLSVAYRPEIAIFYDPDLPKPEIQNRYPYLPEHLIDWKETFLCSHRWHNTMIVPKKESL